MCALEELTREDIELFWPSLAAIDFGPRQISQAFDSQERLGKTLDVEFAKDFRAGLDHANYALEASQNQLTDKHGNSISDPRAYIYASLARDGYYTAPKGYVSVETQRMRDRIARKEEEAKAFQQLQEAEKKAAEAELYKGFDAMLEEGEANSLYCILRERLPSVARRGEAQKLAGFVSAMRHEYKKHVQGEN